jgi:hypothetical protein
MANITGLITVNGKEILEVDADPSAAGGTPAPTGSLAMFDNAGAGYVYVKAGAADTAWTGVDITPSWDLAGNALTGAEFFGSTNDFDVIMKRNNIEQMRIASNALLIGLSSAIGGRLQVNDATAGADLIRECLDAAGSNPVYKVTRMHRLATTTATPSPYSILIPDDHNALVETRVCAHQTGGSVGSVGDGASYIRTLHARNIGGTVSNFNVQSDYTYEVAAALNVTAGVTGANVQFSVVGAANRNITWGIHTNVIFTGT